MRILCIIFLAVLLLKSTFAGSQGRILPFNEVMKEVRDFHPLANIARLGPDMAKAQLMKAKGGFDPVAAGNINQKYFDSKKYYSLINGQLKLPTRLGLDLVGGYETNSGIFLSQDDTTPPGGLFFGGISLPVGQGLIIDERRAELWSAGIAAENAALNQQNLTNDLLFDASEMYWEWFRSYHILKVAEEAFANAEARQQAIRRYAATGDRPAIDTTEALIQVQNLAILLNQVTLDYAKSTRYFTGFFWDASGNNKGLPPGRTPQEIEQVLTGLPADGMAADFGPGFFNTGSHPYLMQLNNKIRQLNIDRRLKKDKLKPRADLKYIPLAEAVGNNPLSNFNLNNYRFGIEFKMPLFLRKERGDLKMAELKLREGDLFLRHKTTELFNKFDNKITEWQATADQIAISTDNVRLYRTMLEAEKKLFETGESSVFLINAREQAYINSRIKLVDTVAKNRSAYYAIYYLAGKLANFNIE